MPGLPIKLSDGKREDLMRFIHIADIHLGAKPDSMFPWSSQREKEVWESFDRIIGICNEKDIDLLLIAGDLFHRQPLVRELKEVGYRFSKLARTQVVLIAGNHDYIGARSNYTGFSWGDRVHMLYDEAMDSVYLEELNTEVYGFSYHTRDIMEARYQKVYPGCEERINILLAHGGDERNVPIDKKALLSNGFDYVALGHIHKPELFGQRMAYSGSLEPLDKNETGPRGYILGEIGKEGNDSRIAIEFVPNSLRQYIKMELPVHPEMTNGELLDLARTRIWEAGTEHIYQLRLTGRRDRDVLFSEEDLKALGNVVEVLDETVPDYDFDALYLENRDNIIGLYIKKIRESDVLETRREKALYYGLEALLRGENVKR